MSTRRISSGLLVAVLAVTTLVPGAAVTIDSPTSDQVTTATLAHLERRFGQLPLYFVENQGQLDGHVAYYVQGSDKMIYFTPEGVTFALSAPLTQTAAISEDQMASLHPMGRTGDEAPVQSQRWTVKLDFVGANLDVRPVGQEETEAIVSYFKGQPDQWHAGLPTYARIVYADLWPGIDLVYHGTVDRLKYEFIVHPGADPAQIQLAYRGATDVTVNDAGQMEVSTPLGGFADDVPEAYQEIDGRRVAVDAAYDLQTEGDGEGAESAQAYSFALGSYDPSHSLIIDPAVLVYAGYLGGLDQDEGFGIAVDSTGNAYVIGETASSASSFPVTGGPDLSYNGLGDIFIVKINASGSELVYAGYIGGSSEDRGESVVVDSEGNAYITGETGSTEVDFPVAVGPGLTHSGNWDVFVAKVNAGGTGLDYCGYIGGSDQDWGQSIAISEAGNAYVTGRTRSTEATFPETIGPGLVFGGGNWDAFVAKVKVDGTGLDYCGYIGGPAQDTGEGIAVDDAGNAYVTGGTLSETSFPVAVGPDLTYNGSGDAFVAKVEADGTGLVYAGYIGGSGGDSGYGIALDDTGNAYITGGTSSLEDTFPVAVGPDLTYNGGTYDAFVAKINAAGNGLIYAGYIGGSESDYGYGIALNDMENAYIVGSTWSTEATFPVTVGPDLAFNGIKDAFVARVTTDGTGLGYCGYIGGSDDDWAEDIAVDDMGNAYVVGTTHSTETSFPVTVGPVLTPGGGRDAFVAKVRGELGVLVVDENGDSLEGAKVYRNGVFSDTTPADGFLAIPDLQAGDTLAATWLVTEVGTSKGHHNQDSTQDWGYRVYLTSVPIDNQGNPGLHTVTDLNATQVLTAAQSNALVGFNIVVSVEWDASAAYLNDLHQGFQNASDYLYDATDGQMFFERVTIYDDRGHWADADYWIQATNQLRASASVEGWSTLDGHAFFGRATYGGGTWEGRGFHTYIHEFGHYGLGLYDSYFYYDANGDKQNSACTSAAVLTNTTPQVNATVMYAQHSTTEFAMQGVVGLWSPQCAQTRQWQVHGESDWETMVEYYGDTEVPTRWQFVTPADRGGVVAGPGNIPVTEWMTSTVSDASTDTCFVDPTYRITRGGVPITDTNVFLLKTDYTIYQGKTDTAGEITVLGASNGDVLLFMIQEEFVCRQKEVVVSCASTPDVPDAAADPIEVVLEETPFTLHISVIPTPVDYQAQVQVKASTTLSGTPQAKIFQLGSSTPISVALAYDSSAGVYTGTADLDPSLSLAGNVGVTAQDTMSHTLQVFNTFGLFPVTASGDAVAYSGDGLVELYLPEGSLSGDAYVSFVPDAAVGPPPGGLIILSGPYSVQASPGVTLSNDVGLSLKYLDTGGTLDGIDPSTAQIYRWDAGTEQWVPLTSSVLDGRAEVSTAIDAFGTYAVMAAEPQYPVYLPVVTYDY